MTAALLACLGLTAVALGAACGLLAAGTRAGDHLGDTTLTAVEPDHDGRGIWLTVHNPGPQAVLLGATVQRCSPRLRFEAGYFVSVPRRTSHAKFLAGKHAVVCAVDAGQAHTILVGTTAVTRPRAELVLAVGEADRLRIIHRAITLPRAHWMPRTQDLAPV